MASALFLFPPAFHAQGGYGDRLPDLQKLLRAIEDANG